MLQGLQAAPGALVIMDAGIATQANVDWLLAHQYRYLVVRRGGIRQFDAAEAVSTETANGQTVRLQAVPSADGKELGTVLPLQRARGQGDGDGQALLPAV